MRKSIRKFLATATAVCMLVGSINMVQAANKEEGSSEWQEQKGTDFALGNSSSKILNGGLSAAYDDLNYYSTNEGVVVNWEDKEEIITSDIVSNINVINDKLYYTTFENGKDVIKVSDLFCENQNVILESDDHVEMMYVINDEYIMYLSSSMIHKLDLTSEKIEIVDKASSITSFVPTEYGNIIADYKNGVHILSIKDKVLLEAESYYVEGNNLVVEVEHESYQIDLASLFSSDFKFEKHAKSFEMYGKYTIEELFAYDEDVDDIEDIVISEEEQAADERYLKTIGTDSSNNNTLSRSTFSLNRALVASTASASTYSVSTGQQNIVKRARQMVEFKWTPLANVKGWKGNTTFQKGVTYIGVPYGQCVERGSWLGYGTSLDAFAKYVKNSSSLLYTSTASSSGNIAPYYSSDCSTFVSYCWGLSSRKTTSTLPSVSNVSKITATDNSILQVGDCLDATGNHVMLITARVYNSSGELIGYDIMHQTPPSAVKVSNVSLAKIDQYFKSGYVAYRYDGRNSVSYTHYCSVPIDDTCAQCSGNTSVASTLNIGSYTCPTTLTVGQSFSLNGAISSNYTISNVTVGVYTTSGTAKIVATATPNSKTYNVSNLDAQITFGKLSVGAYVYKVIATDAKGTKTLVSRTFMVVEPSSTLGISSYTYPSTLSVGQSFSLKGAISSNYTISNVTVGVYTLSGTAKIVATATPNTKTYNVSKLDAKITFGKLSAGTYVYKVIATDSKGTKTLVSRTFTIK